MPLVALSLILLAVSIQPPPPADENPARYARIQTSMGNIDLELFRNEAPVTTANFLQYATDGYYDRLTFHRVVPGVLIQGGGYNVSLYGRPTRDPIPNEAENGLENRRGTIAMARYDDPDSATSQFFINLADNQYLDQREDEFGVVPGYAVFGRVIAGIEIADAISQVEAGPGEGGIYLPAEVPVEPIIILRIDPIEGPNDGPETP